VFRRQASDGSTVTLGHEGVGDGRLHRVVEFEKPQRVGDGGSGSSDARGQGLLREPELVHQLPIGARGFERVEVFALEVLDQRQLELLSIRQLPNDRRNAFQPCRPSCTDPTLPGNQLVPVDDLGH